MRHYEVMVILDPSIDERTVPATLERFLEVVKSSGGTVDEVDVMGKRRLAFDINKQSEGVYVVLQLQCEPAAVKEMDRQLNLSESVLRTKVLRPEPRPAEATS